MKIKQSIIIIFSLAFVNAADAQWDYGFDFSKAGSAGLQFLKIGVGAKECALGEATLAVSRGVNAIFWNPAGIAHVEKRAVSFSYSGWLLGVEHSAVAAAMNIEKIGVVGLSAIYLGVPEFEETTVLQQAGTGRMVSASDVALGLAFARRFTDKLSMGAQVRYVKEQLDQDSFSSVLMDIGALYDTGFRHLRIAVAAQHFGPDIKMLRDTFRMPLLFKLGLADDLLHTEDNRVTLIVDLIHPTDNTERMSFGLEYGAFDWVFLRSGYRLNSDLGEWSFGVGLEQSLLGVAGTVDYSYTDFGEIMGAVNRVSVSFNF
ncbi:MAG: PorV/PorQ family protein [Candidatus Zhuqueibacterota bacterium]